MTLQEALDAIEGIEETESCLTEDLSEYQDLLSDLEVEAIA